MNTPNLKLIIRMSLPPAISMIIQSLYNIIDSMFITKYDPLAMEAISLVFPIQNIILALAVGAGIGINAFTSIKLGEKNKAKAHLTASHGVFLSFIHYLFVLILGLLLAPLFIKSFTDNQTVIDYSLTYINLIIIFSFTTIFELAFEKILQADGKMNLPMVALLLGAIINIILDPIFIFSLDLGILGAAIATVIGQVACLIVIIIFAFSKINRIKITFKNFKFDKEIIKSIYLIAIPSFFITAIPSFMVSIMNYILAIISDMAITTFGIYYKLQNFVYMGVCGISQGTMPIMGYYYGAKEKNNLEKTTKLSVILSIIIAIPFTIIFILLPHILLKLFYDNNQLINQTKIFLQIASLGFIFGSINYIMASYFQSTQKAFTSLSISLLRQIILLLPIALLLSIFFNEKGIYLALFICEIITSIYILFIYKKGNSK